MIKIMKHRWDANKGLLRKTLTEHITELEDCDYTYLLKTTFDILYNNDSYNPRYHLKTDSITVIDNGDYQGTIMFLIPFDTYQPCEWEYLMTYIGYGSCSGCDALQAAQCCEGDLLIDSIMNICKDLVCNTIRPYNNAWRHEEAFDPTDETIV